MSAGGGRGKVVLTGTHGGAGPAGGGALAIGEEVETGAWAEEGKRM